MKNKFDTDRSFDQFKLLQLENADLKYAENPGSRTVEKLCNSVLSSEEALHLKKYSDLEVFVKCRLSLPHDSADVERSFSKSGRTLTETKSKMEFRMFNARLTICYYIATTGPI